MPQWCTGTVVRRKDWSHGLFTIAIEAAEVLPFEPGQFLHLGVFPAGKEGDRDSIINRPYSVASPHGRELDFFIVLVDDGELTPHLWDLQVGQKVLVSRKAAGSFTLKKCPDAKHLWLFATGTGLAPYIAMLCTPQPWSRFEQIFVIHGVRHASDLAYTDELYQMKADHPDKFHVVQTLTRERHEETLWGRIPALIEDGQLEEFVECGLNSQDSAVYLCGNPAMLDSMEELLGKRGMKKHRSKSPGHIVLERYW